jgi:hypothetical protein
MATARRFLGGCGIQTSAIAFGGETPPTTQATEEYNGSAWTGGGNLVVGKTNMGSAGVSESASIAFAGGDTNGEPITYFTATEEYNGTAWTTAPASSTYR